MIFSDVNDETDFAYQTSIEPEGDIRIARLGIRDIYQRNRHIALERIRLSGFVCELDSSHPLFLSRHSGAPYLEAHHFVPMSTQSSFPVSLDNLNNVFSLCPGCHRAVHHAEAPVARSILESLASRRNVLASLGLGLEDLYVMYGINEIH